MADVFATSFGVLNYSGMLFNKGNVKTPLSSIIGSKAKTTNHVEFVTGQEYSSGGNGSQPKITENQSLTAPDASVTTREQKTNVTQIFQESVGISYGKQSKRIIKVQLTEQSIKWYESTNVLITSSERYDSDMYENDISITGVYFKDDEEEKEYIAGTDDYCLDLSTNGLIQENPQVVIDTLYVSLKDFSYRPYEATIKPAPYLYPMDRM